MKLKSAHTGKIGKVFMNARIRSSLTEAEIAAKTYINIEYIKGIESGDYSVFPARTYAVKYFEKYSDFLGLNLSFFDIYNADVVAEAEREEKDKNFSEPFLEKNMIFTAVLIILTLIAVIFLYISDESAYKEDDQIINENNNFELLGLINNPIERINIGKDPLKTDIYSFMKEDILDSNEVNVNVDFIESN
ncbi:MAG: hypothetical protein CMD68_04130 [Gammaproteobacteria bacterium]|nr:hypothetical protein [Gammaproteobacteria bacterium]|tara:strand:+ start:91 stop:663 length:573 start_codon:yes stop_codon:yes gene_type:complete